MAVATSAVPVVKAAIVARLQADPQIAAAGLQVTYGKPAQNLLEIEGVIVGPGRGRPDWASIGGGERRERVTVRVLCHAHVKGAADEQENEQRAYEIAAMVEQALMADQGVLGGLIEMPEGIAESNDNTDLIEGGYGTTVALQFAGTARLTNT
ncbi:MAG TPA: hypothetical protein VFZ00_01430 [Solirubrobacter sp.]|nr:hypothetical protein [Solirubrobacter sp.]